VVEIGHLYTTLSAHIHDPKQGGDALVISKESSLTIEGCLGFASLKSQAGREAEAPFYRERRLF